MGNDVKSERQFLLVTAGGFAVFVVMLFLWSQAVAAQASAGSDKATVQAQVNGTVQEVYVKALSTGKYNIQRVEVKRGIPVRFHFSAESGAGCGKVLVIKKFGVQLVSRNGEDSVAEFTPTEAGTFEYSCTMRMFRGTLVVVP